MRRLLEFRGSIAIVNVLLGWTGIGWVAALV
ncbi:MAG: superinfection immunity protein [Oceanisphaera sp.]